MAHAMIFDTDDLHETNHRLDLLTQLHDVNPAFRMTAFTVPAHSSEEWLDALPPWIEIAGHGWSHGGPACNDPREAEYWSYEQTMDVLLALPGRFVDGWKSPGWMTSDGTYQALIELGWWCADHPENNPRRPDGLLCHVAGASDHVHTHVQNVCGNGLEELFPQLLAKVAAATEFLWVSEVVAPWRARVPA
jgi:hypothetical protein